MLRSLSVLRTAAKPATRSAMSVTVKSVVLVCVIGIGLAQAASGGRPHAIQPLGSFHQGESVARNGERWLALWTRSDGSGSRLANVRVSVARVEDQLVDTAGQKTGEEVSVPVPANSRETAIMLLRGEGLKSGDVVIAQVEDRSADGLLAYTFRIGGQESRLDTRCTPGPAPAEEENDDLEHAQCRIELVAGKTRQTILTISGSRRAGAAVGPWILGNDASPHLLFAGDLDSDGRLDLLLDTTNHYNLSRPTLFLSSVAPRSEFLRQVSEHRALGC
jgi:hypothetical protein